MAFSPNIREKRREVYQNRVGYSNYYYGLQVIYIIVFFICETQVEFIRGMMMNIYNNEQEQKFLELRVQGKSLKSISKELEIPTDVLLEWDFELAEDVHDAQSIEYDKIVEDYELAQVMRFKYLAELYDRLKKELDKRDFSGLPTDKLYIILSSVYEQIQNQLKRDEPDDWYDDDFDPLNDMPEDLE